MLLVGGSIAFASQTLDRGHQPDTIVSGPPPPPQLTILPPSTALTRADAVDLMVVAPSNLRLDQHYVVRVYVNDTQVRRLDLPDQEQFTLKDVPLVEGANSITASIVGDGGEGQPSAPVAVTRDDVAPVIKILEPIDHVYTENELLLGKTEPGADIEIVDSAGKDIESTIQLDGHFSAALTLRVGNNDLILHSTDAAGNKTTIGATIVRSPSAATIELTVLPTQIYAADLPATIELSATIRDELGQPLDGTVVVFGVSPPDRATTTYNTTSVDGRARLDGLTVDRGEATGQWLVTALATLPSGIELRADASFNLLAGAPKSPGRH